MTRALYVSSEPTTGKPRASALGCGWLDTVPSGVVATLPCAIVIGGNGVQVFSDSPPITPATVLAAIAADAALDASAKTAQDVLDGNATTLRTRAQTALAANATYLAIASPTAAQVATQSKALTRQVDALIRLSIGQLDSVADS